MAVLQNSEYGPTFGSYANNDNSDLFVNTESNTRTNNAVNPSNSYYDPYGAGGRFIHGGVTNKFQTKEIEVFEII